MSAGTGMDPAVVLLILAAAAMHAIWNAFLKVGGDRLMTIAGVIAVGALFAPALIAQGGPLAPEAWPFLALSVAIHTIYFLLLLGAYRFGDLSVAYPIARGSAPILVALGAMLFAGETLRPTEIAGVVVVSAGIVSLALGHRLVDGWRALVYPLATGAAIAAYTVSDGIGVRLAGSTPAFIGWLFVWSALPIAAIALARRGRGALVFLRAHWRPTLIGGVLAFTAYGLVIWALTLGAMAHVSALRETSVVIGALIGTRFLGEASARRRVWSAAAVAAGVVILNLSG